MKMEKYICDICGHTFEIELEKTNNGDMNCPICKGHCLTEEEMQSREDMAKLIDDDKGDDDMTPKQDADEEKELGDKIMEDYIIEYIKSQIKQVGNDKFFYMIERNLFHAKQRARYRKYFLLAGGEVPEGEQIMIKENKHEDKNN
jgi:DNA-directed RNA polymerase subunit RPC12/RpoP